MTSLLRCRRRASVISSKPISSPSCSSSISTSKVCVVSSRRPSRTLSAWPSSWMRRSDSNSWAITRRMYSSSSMSSTRTGDFSWPVRKSGHSLAAGAHTGVAVPWRRGAVTAAAGSPGEMSV
ncbi:hypothetical protein D9M70_615280 [compost metagenome]